MRRRTDANGTPPHAAVLALRADGDFGVSASYARFPNALHTGLKHDEGAVAMARKGDDTNSAGSQFHIYLGAQHQLDGDYTVFW